jgi:hypothetical protein
LSHPDAGRPAIEGDGGFAMFMAVSAVAAAGGAACTSVGDRFMRNYLKFAPRSSILDARCLCPQPPADWPPIFDIDIARLTLDHRSSISNQ